MEQGSWSICPICGGSGRCWFDVCRDCPLKAECDACRGLGVAQFVEADVAEAMVRPCDLGRHEAPYDSLAA